MRSSSKRSVWKMSKKWMLSRKVKRDVYDNSSYSSDSSCRSTRCNTNLSASDEHGSSAEIYAADIEQNGNGRLDIDVQHLRLFVGTWNVAGIKPPTDQRALEEWLGVNDRDEPADIYVIGFQEIVPLNAGNILGNEDKGESARKWDTLIMSTLNGGFSSASSCNSSSYGHFNKPSTSMFGSITHNCKQVHDCSHCPAAIPTADLTNNNNDYFAATMRTWHHSNACCNSYNWGSSKISSTAPSSPVIQSERYFHNHNEDEVFQEMDCHRRHSSADQSEMIIGRLMSEDLAAIPKLRDRQNATIHCTIRSSAERNSHQRDSLVNCRKQSRNAMVINGDKCRHAYSYGCDGSFICSSARGPKYIQIVCKQMVGLYVSVWVKRDLCSRIKAVEVCCVGCGIMGFLGNKGAVSVSLSLDETNMCFICSHLNSGGKDSDAQRRNADVREILRRTRFRRRRRHRCPKHDRNLSPNAVISTSPRSNALPCSCTAALPRTILAHDRIIWFGDLNYRLSIPIEELGSLMAKEDWKALLEKDQLKHEKGINGVFEGWQEGHISFTPTYKYVPNTNVYYMHHVPMDEGGIIKRRAPAWCDRILWNGKGLKQISYTRSESTYSDHRPVASLFVVDMEVLNNQHEFKTLNFKQYSNPKSCENSSLAPYITKVKVEEIFQPRFTQPIMATKGDNHLIIFNMMS